MQKTVFPAGIIQIGVAFSVLALAGCRFEPGRGADCTQAERVAREAAASVRPPGEWVSRLPPSCRPAAVETFDARLARDCAPLYAFRAARSGRERPGACTSRAFDSAWSLGTMLGELEAEKREIEQQLAAEGTGPDQRRALKRRLVVIERDLPQIEALARMDGFLPPAPVPGGNAR